jgi:hypothetical protein
MIIEDIFRLILGVPPSPAKIKKDLEVMRLETTSWYDSLIPWQQEKELELLSLTQERKWVKNSIDRILIGVFQSIYTEPMFTYAYVDYMKGKGKNAVVQIRTKAHEFVYRIKKKITEVIVDGQFVAVINPEGVMYSVRTRRQLGRVSEISRDYFGIIIGEKEVAHLLNPDTIDRVNPRAFIILENMTDQEELLFTSISLIEVVLRTNKLI